MRTTLALAAAGLVVALAAHTRGLTALGSPKTSAAEGPAVDTSFLKQYAVTRGFMLGRPQKPKVTPDGKAVLFLRADGKSPKQSLFEFDVATGKTRELLSAASLLQGAEENLSPEEKARRERQRVSAGGFTDFHLDPSGTRVLVKLSNRLYVVDRLSGKTRELKTRDGAAIVDPKWSPDDTRIAYVRGHDVFVYDLVPDEETQLTTGGTEVKTHGLAEFVAQEEMHRDTGFWWSPDGKHIAYVEADHTGVETWYVADPFKPDAKPAEQYYPRPGKKNVSVRLGVISIRGGKTTWMKFEFETFEYLARVAWSESGILVLLQPRGQQRCAYGHYNPTTGYPTGGVASHPEGDKWENLPPDIQVLPDGKRFLAYLPNRPSEREPSPPEFQFQVVTQEYGPGTASGRIGYADQVVGVEPGTERLIYTGRLPDPTQQHVFVQPRKIKKASDPGIPLTAGPGIHTAVISKSFKVGAFTSTTLTTMPVTIVRATEPNAEPRGTLPSVAAEPPFVPNVVVEKVGDYWTGIVRPRDFDPKKKYPVIVYTYGGPTSQVVTRAMQPWLVRQWLADQGFVVVAIDNRGTAGRGREWEKAVYQKFGTVPLEDQVKGLQALCDKFPELDRERAGVVGWSFGGYMAANAVLREPDVFKAAVAGAPVTDWEDYDTHYTERYMGLLPESKAAYEAASLLPLAKTLRRPLLLVHGTADDNVYFRHSLRLENELFRAGREFDVLPLPGVTHMVGSDPVVMERFWAKTAGFFRLHLGAPK